MDTNKDKAIEELFLASKPQFDDSEAFMASLNKRLNAVEYIKQHQEATIRRYKMAMVAAFVVGIISGGATIAFVMSMPTDVPLFNFSAETELLKWFVCNARPIITAAISLFMTVALISIVNNIMDIINMRANRSVV